MQRDTPIPVLWGSQAAPFVYADQLGPGGRTARRWAEVEGSAVELAQNPCDPRGTYDCPPWTKQLGQLDEPPAWWPPGVPCPGAVPQIVSAEECARREAAAYERGRAEEQQKTIKVAAVSTAVSVVVAGAIGYLIGR
jgi:hypothetical protein